MAEEMFIFAVTTGVITFLVAVLFGSRARRYRKGIINKRLTTHNNHMIKPSLKDVGQTWLALLIIVPAFILIAYMLLIQQGTINNALSSVRDLNSSAATSDTRIDALTGFYREINQANQNMFALMTTVFGAWVAAVVAFYFGTKSLAKTQDSLDKQSEAIGKALPSQQKLSGMTVAQLLDENDTAKNVITVTMQTNIGEVRKKFTDNKDLTNVLVVDVNQKPLGLLYQNDLAQLLIKDEKPDAIDGKPLEERIENIKDDFVTHTPWNKTTGVKNYAELRLTDNLQIAQSAMQATGAGGPKVRGVVLDTQGKVIGIVDYTMISSILQQE
jgi:CBS domain-containing protein